MAVCYSGDLGATDEVLAPIRALGDPVVDLLAEQPYTQVQSYLDETEPKGSHYYWKTEYLAELSDDLLSTLRELFAECPIPDAAARHPAPRRGAQRARRGRRGGRQPGRPLRLRRERHVGARTSRTRTAFRQWVRDAWERLRPFSTGRHLHQLPDRRRGRGARPRDLRRELRPPRRGQDGATTRTTCSARTATSALADAGTHLEAAVGGPLRTFVAAGASTGRCRASAARRSPSGASGWCRERTAA